MGIYVEWMRFRESNARKRAISSALKGERPPLPGSYSANPRTDVNAMDVAKDSGVVRKKFMDKCNCQKCKNKCPCGDECPCNKFHEEDSPDYSIDKWLDMAKDLGDDLSLMSKKGDEEEEKIDQEIKTKKTKKGEKDKPDQQDAEERDSAEEEELWNKIDKHLGGESSSKDSKDSSKGLSKDSSTSEK